MHLFYQTNSNLFCKIQNIYIIQARYCSSLNTIYNSLTHTKHYRSCYLTHDSSTRSYICIDEENMNIIILKKGT